MFSGAGRLLRESMHWALGTLPVSAPPPPHGRAMYLGHIRVIRFIGIIRPGLECLPSASFLLGNQTVNLRTVNINILQQNLCVLRVYCCVRARRLGYLEKPPMQAFWHLAVKQCLQKAGKGNRSPRTLHHVGDFLNSKCVCVMGWEHRIPLHRNSQIMNIFFITVKWMR